MGAFDCIQGNILAGTMVEQRWPEIERAAAENALVLLPVGVIEEHGRHLPTGTDIYFATAQAVDISNEMARRGAPCVVAPPFWWGINDSQTRNFPGTFTARPETVGAMIHDILESLERAGFKRVMVVNAHGDAHHQQAILSAMREYNAGHGLRARWMAFENDPDRGVLEGFEDCLELLPELPFERIMECECPPRDQFDFHAGGFETASMTELFPRLVDMDTAYAARATMLTEDDLGKWASGRPEERGVIPDGHVGDPAFARHIRPHIHEMDVFIAERLAGRGDW